MNNKILRQLHPKITQDTLSSSTSANGQDKIGSYDNNRQGALRGAPSVVWYSTDSKEILTTLQTNKAHKVYINGYNMNTISNIYLSGSSVDMFDQSVQEYSYFQQKYPEDNRLNTENPSITAISLTSWTVMDDNNINISIPVARLSGDVQLILQGPAGYSTAPGGKSVVMSVTGNAPSTVTAETTVTTSTETTATTSTETTGTTATVSNEITGIGPYISDHLQDL